MLELMMSKRKKGERTKLNDKKKSFLFFNLTLFLLF